MYNKKLAILATLIAFVVGSVATAQTDLDGSDLIVTGSGPWNVSYTNRNNSSQSIVAIRDLNNGTRYTYSGAFTGNIHIDITHGTATNNNENRFTFSNTGNSFTGGITMHGGILYVSAANQLPSGCALTLDNSVLMSSVAATYSGAMTIPAGSFGGLRPSADITYSGVISGDGDLFITAENGKKVTLSGANTYTGVTSIGTHQGGSTSKDNSKAYLILGADNTLPATTVVEMGKSQNASSDYSYTGATVANLELNGKTQTIGGLYGSSVATVTANAASTLTINTPSGENYAYDGSISGTVNLVKTGAGTQTLSGNGKSVSLASLAINEGTLAFGDKVNLTVSGKLTSATSPLDLNGSNLTYTSNSAGDFNNVAITNTNTNTATQSVVSIVPSSALTAAQTLSQKISGNTRLVVKLPQNQENNSRLVLNNSSNDFTGGLYIEQGTVQISNRGSLGTNKQIDIKHASLMTSVSLDSSYTINLVSSTTNERGAIRATGSSSSLPIGAYITGVGSLEIVYDNPVTLTNTNNDYQGKTYIGNFQWRASSGSGDTSAPATLNLGASGVLPDTTEVVFGSGTTGAQTLNLNGYNETVAGITNSDGKGVITSSNAATLTLIGNGNYTFAGKVTGSATLDKQGTGTLTMSGANTGSIIASEGTLVLSGDNSGAKSITLKNGANLVALNANALATTLNLEDREFSYQDGSFIKNTKFVASQGDVLINVPLAGAPSGTYARQLFTGTARDMSYFTNPQYISNMDKIANTAYKPADTVTYFTADIWGKTTGDENNTNLLQTNVVNTTDAAITLDFAYQFHNSAYLAITDSNGNKTVVMGWKDTNSGKDYASNTGSYTFQPGETYTVEARLHRFNRTIGANSGGVNGTSGTLVGYGARVSGTDGEYLPLNYDGNNWTFSDGSFINSTSVNFNAKSTTINSGATLEFNTQNNDFNVTSPFNGAGTLIVNPAEGFTHTYSGNIGGSLSLVKYGDGVLVLNHANDMSGTVDVQAGEVVYAQAGAMNFVSGLTIAQDAQMTVNLPASDGAAGVSGVVQNNGTITVANGRFRTWGVSGEGTIVMDGGTLMNLGSTVDGTNYAETIIDNAIVIEEGKTGTFNVGWAKNTYPDSKLQLDGSLSGAGDFVLETNHDAPTALSQIAPLVPNFSSSDFTGNVITNSGYNMLVMGKENAFGESVGTLQDNGWVDVNGYNQTFAGLTGTGNLINRGSADATFTLNVPEGETTKYEGKVYGIANQSDGKSFQNISFVKSGEGTAQFDAGANELSVKEFLVAGGRLDVKEYLTGDVLVNGGVLSPGNSVGTLNVTGNVSVVDGKALFEFGAFGSNEFDVLNILGDDNAFAAGDGMIELYFENGDADAWAADGAEYLLVSDEGFTAGNYDSWLSNYTNLFGLTGKADGLYLVALASPEPGAGVPEPSTWALLALGVIGLMYWRKRK